MAYRAAHAPRVRYCLQLEFRQDGPALRLRGGSRRRREVGVRNESRHGAGGARGSRRVRELCGDRRAGGPAHERGLGVGLRAHGDRARRCGRGARPHQIRPLGHDPRVAEVVRTGQKIDWVDDDGKTPRPLSTSESRRCATSTTPRGARFGTSLSGRPAGPAPAGSSATYGDMYEWGKTPASAIKEHEPRRRWREGGRRQWIAVNRREDNGFACGDWSFFDGNDQPIVNEEGIHTSTTSMTTTTRRGSKPSVSTGEPVTTLTHTLHEARFAWDPIQHTYELTYRDAEGRLQVVRGMWFVALRRTMNARGDLALSEFLDCQGNRVVTAFGMSANRYSYDEHGHLIASERLDPSGALMQGAEGFARETIKRDERDNPVEQRYFDEKGNPQPRRRGSDRATHVRRAQPPPDLLDLRRRRSPCRERARLRVRARQVRPAAEPRRGRLLRPRRKGDGGRRGVRGEALHVRRER